MKSRQDQFKHFREEEWEMKSSAAFPVHILCVKTQLFIEFKI